MNALRDAIVASNAIIHILHIFESKSDEYKIYAIKSILNLSLVDKYRKSIADAGAIKSFVVHLDNIKYSEYAANTILNISKTVAVESDIMNKVATILGKK